MQVFFCLFQFQSFSSKVYCSLSKQKSPIPLAMTGIVQAMRACLNLNLVVIIPLECHASFQSEAEEQCVTTCTGKIFPDPAERYLDVNV